MDFIEQEYENTGKINITNFAENIKVFLALCQTRVFKRRTKLSINEFTEEYSRRLCIQSQTDTIRQEEYSLTQ